MASLPSLELTELYGYFFVVRIHLSGCTIVYVNKVNLITDKTTSKSSVFVNTKPTGFSRTILINIKWLRLVNYKRVRIVSGLY